MPSTEIARLTLPEKTEMASLLAKSGLIPKAFQQHPENVFVAIEYGQALGIEPIMALSEINVINGTPSLSATMMMTLARAAGHKVRLEGDSERATCVIVRNDDPDYEIRVDWDKGQAQKADLWGKGHWAKNPGLMLKYRAASECIRLACPEVLAGIKYTPEEVSEFTTPQVTVTAAPQPAKEPAKDPAGAEKQRTVQSRMKALGLNGARLKEFAERALGTSVGTWKSLDEDDQATVLAALDEWESTGADPTLPEIVDAEIVKDAIVDPATGEITQGGEQA